MTELESAARQALDFCEELATLGGKYPYVNETQVVVDARKTSAALREALAEQAEQEPVEKSYYIEGVEHGFKKGVERCAELIESGEFGIGNMMSMHDDASVAEALRELHAAPVRTKDLTDDEIYTLYSEPCSDREMIEFARAVIAKDREKNNANNNT